MSDAELNKAALLIAKLLLRTREGKIQWKFENDPLARALASSRFYKADLGEGLEAHLSSDDKALQFKLWGPPATELPQEFFAGIFSGRDNNDVISILLDHSHGKTGLISPESVVYRDLAELIFLAENPKSVSDDLRYQQALTHLDKLSA